jgi:hypothetical protein
MNILSTIQTKTVILKVDVESFECRVCSVISGLTYKCMIITQAVSREVAGGQSGHQIPFIIMEWTMLQVMPEYAACVDWLLDGGYTPHHWLSYAEYTREQVLAFNPWWQGPPKVHDIIWLHSTADPGLLKP